MKSGRVASSAVLLLAACAVRGDVAFSPGAQAPAASGGAPVSLASPAAARPWVGAWFSSGGDAVATPLRLARWKDAADFVLTPFSAAEMGYCRQAGVVWAPELAASSPVALPDEAAMQQAVSGGRIPGWSVAVPSARQAAGHAPGECQPVYDLSKKLISSNPQAPVVTALPDPWAEEFSPDFAPCYSAGSAAGVALWCGRTWDAYPESQEARGLSILREGESIRMTLPSQPASVFAEWSVTMPPAARLKFRYRAGDRGGDGVRLSVRVLAGMKPETVWEQDAAPRAPGTDGFSDADVDLSQFAGSRIKVRLEAAPGEARQTTGDAADWHDPMLVAAGGEASLIEHANWWRMRAGYRPLGSPRDVVTGVTESRFDPSGCELKLGLIAARCSVTGKPFLLNGVHPTGDTDTASPLSLAAFWARVLPHKPASVVFYRSGAQEPDTVSRDVEPLVTEIARWRSFLQMVNPGAAAVPARPLTLFVSPESGSRLGGARALEPFGLDVRALNTLGDDPKLKSVVVWAEYLNSESGPRLARLLQGDGKTPKAIIFCGDLRGPGADAVASLLPFRCEKADAREVSAAVPGGVSLPVWVPGKPVWSGLAGWEAVRGPDGETLAAARGPLLVVAGLPLDRQDGPGNALAKLAAQWLSVVPYSVLDSGFVKLARGDVRAAAEGLWSMEGPGSITVPSSIIAYDFIERAPASGKVNGPACLYCFPRRGARLVDPGVCYVRNQRMEGQDIVVELDCPANLAEQGRYEVVFWSPKTPAPSLESGGAWTVSLLGEGFWKAVCGKPGSYTLKISGAMLPKPPPSWNPADH